MLIVPGFGSYTHHSPVSRTTFQRCLSFCLLLPLFVQILQKTPMSFLPSLATSFLSKSSPKKYPQASVFLILITVPWFPNYAQFSIALYASTSRSFCCCCCHEWGEIRDVTRVTEHPGRSMLFRGFFSRCQLLIVAGTMNQCCFFGPRKEHVALGNPGSWIRNGKAELSPVSLSLSFFSILPLRWLISRRIRAVFGKNRQ